MQNTINSRDLTQGGIVNKLLQIALPIMGVQFMQMTYNLVDMFWLGRVGADAVAASGTAGMFMWLSGALQLIGRMGAEIGVAQNLGAGNRAEAKHFAQHSVFIAGLLGLLFGALLLVFRAPFIGFFAIQEAQVAADSEVYLAIIALAMPFNYINGAVSGTFTGAGDARSPFIANAAGLITNIILDPLLIFGLSMGVSGAAVATVIAQVVSFSVIVLRILRGKNRPFERFSLVTRLQKAYVSRIFRWGLPVCLESALFTMMSMITSRLVAGFGSGAMAVSRVGSNIESLSWLIGGGFGSALTSFIGQNFGAGKWARIHRGFNISTLIMIGWGIFVTLTLYFGAAPLFGIFLPDPDIIVLGVDYLHILVLCQIPTCLEAVGGGAFRGLGKTFPPSIASILSNMLRVVFAYLFIHLGWGLNGIWWALTLTGSLRGIWIFLWYLASARNQPKVDLSSAA